MKKVWLLNLLWQAQGFFPWTYSQGDGKGEERKLSYCLNPSSPVSSCSSLDHFPLIALQQPKVADNPLPWAWLGWVAAPCKLRAKWLWERSQKNRWTCPSWGDPASGPHRHVGGWLQLEDRICLLHVFDAFAQYFAWAPILHPLSILNIILERDESNRRLQRSHWAKGYTIKCWCTWRYIWYWKRKDKGL